MTAVPRLALAALVAFSWLLTSSAADAEPTALVVAQQGNCSPAYPDFCIPPPPPNLNCDDIPYSDFTALEPDPHGLDGSDNDDRGCENSGKPRFQPQATTTTTTQVIDLSCDVVVVEPDGTVRVPPGCPPVTRPQATTTTVAHRQPLVRTGAESNRQAAAAAVLVACGALVVLVSGRRPRFGQGR